MKRVIAAGTKTHGKILVDSHNFILQKDPDAAGGGLPLIHSMVGDNVSSTIIKTEWNHMLQTLKMAYEPVMSPYFYGETDEALMAMLNDDKFWEIGPDPDVPDFPHIITDEEYELMADEHSGLYDDDTDTNIPPAL